MASFKNGDVEIAYLDEGRENPNAEPIVLVHGFASTKEVNWVNPGWVRTLTGAGRRAIALDNRGHGQSSKLYEPAEYHSAKMAEDVRALLDHLNPADQVIARDRERLASVRAARAAAAQAYFRAHAAEWDRIRKLHVADAAVEDAIRAALADKPFRSLLDLGTGTGRMLEMFGPDLERGLGIDLSLDMLLLARDRLERAGLKNCSVRQGDLYDLPIANDSFDVIILHQVLHFLDDGGRAIKEAARVLRPGGRLLVVDFAPHEQEFLREQFAHRRLGFAPETVTQWMTASGLEPVLHRSLSPEPGSDGKIAVSLWLARDVRALMATPKRREVA